MHAQYQLSKKSSVRARVVSRGCFTAHGRLQRLGCGPLGSSKVVRQTPPPERAPSRQDATAEDAGCKEADEPWQLRCPARDLGGEIRPYLLLALRRGRSRSSGLDPWPATGESACLGGDFGAPTSLRHRLRRRAAAPLRFVLLDTAVVILVDYGVK